MALFTSIKSEIISSRKFTLSFDDTSTTEITISIGDIVTISYIKDGDTVTVTGRYSDDIMTATRCGITPTNTVDRITIDTSKDYVSSMVDINIVAIRSIVKVVV